MAMGRGLKGYDMGSARIAVFVRHGESITNVEERISDDIEGFPLTALGRGQAEDAGRALEKLPRVDHIYTSPVLRAVQTSNIIAKHIDIMPGVDRLLTERGCGTANNRRFKTKEEHRKFVLEQVGNSCPGYESWGSMMDRMERFSRKLRRGEVSVAVSHRQPIASALALVMGKDEIQMWSVGPINGSITIIDFENEGSDAVLAFGSPMVPKVLGG